MFGLRRSRSVPARTKGAPSGPPDTRAYAIGDVHGRLDLLRKLLLDIERHSIENPCEREFIIFLGDLIDRGPESRGVIELLIQARPNLPNPIFLTGNHEEMLLHVLFQDNEKLWDWLTYGGYEFAQSYGVEVGRFATLDANEAAAIIRLAIPPEHLDFIEGFADSFRFGDYLFVHAGIRPGVALENQAVHDLRWIRDGFLDSKAEHDFIVVHGHTITETPDVRSNRIGIDTGAYRTGVLTAIVLEGEQRDFIAVGG